jgi:aminopeptidase N
MKFFVFFSLFWAFLFLYAEEESCLLCRQSASALEATTLGSHYAPDRLIDVLHLCLEVHPDFKKKMVFGKSTIQFTPLVKPLQQVVLHGVNLNIESMDSNGGVESFHQELEQIKGTFFKNVASGRDVFFEYYLFSGAKAGALFSYS